MFRDEMRKRLFNIFDSKQIYFDSYKFGKQQETLFVDIGRFWQHQQNGYISFDVSGTVTVSAPADKFKYGDLHGKIERAKYEDKKYFTFTTDEEPVPFEYNGKDFIKYSIDFTYRVKLEYDNKRKKITGVIIQI